MLTVDTINPAQLAAGSQAAPEWLLAGTNWQLTGSVDLYSQARGEGLASQAWPGRHLQILTIILNYCLPCLQIDPLTCEYRPHLIVTPLIFLQDLHLLLIMI